MAKFLKNFFQSEKRRNSKAEDENRNLDFIPPLEDRRKLSISRSGRMKQNYKKRPSINQEIFGEIQMNEAAESKEYHVHGKKYTEQQIETRRHSESEKMVRVKKKSIEESRTQTARTNLKGNNMDDIKMNLEEIENAFKPLETIID